MYIFLLSSDRILFGQPVTIKVLGLTIERVSHSYFACAAKGSHK